MTGLCIAIDPGLSGGLAVFSGGDLVEVVDMPTLKEGTGNKREIDVNGIIDFIDGQEGTVSEVVVEKQQSMPKQGLASTFKTGVGFGKLLGMLDALAYRYQIVNPKEWSKKVGRPAKSGKDWCIAQARRLYPEHKAVFLKSKDGRADAVLIGTAYFCEEPPKPEPEAKEDVDIKFPDW